MHAKAPPNRADLLELALPLLLTFDGIAIHYLFQGRIAVDFWRPAWCFAAYPSRAAQKSN
jgi:hypothetical protein